MKLCWRVEALGTLISALVLRQAPGLLTRSPGAWFWVVALLEWARLLEPGELLSKQNLRHDPRSTSW